MTSARVLVVGESVLDIVRRSGAADETAPGGSPANVAVGLARLGTETTLLTQLADDDAGAMIAQHLAGAGVVLAADPSVEATPTAIATLDEAGAATYEFRIAWTLGSDAAARAMKVAASHVHVGSLGALVDPGATAVRAAVTATQGSATVSFDPNIRPELVPSMDHAREAVEWYVARADVVKASDEDVAAIYPDRDPVEVADAWSRRGPAFVALTRGGEGSVLVRRGERISVDARPAEVVDTVGAGDSFMSALIDGLRRLDLLGDAAALRSTALGSLVAVAERAATAAAMTVSRRGAEPPTSVMLDGVPVRR
ncbi:PfkB family carbohydrate kinase [Demequina sp. NBRC 110052]|uniref:PfkB family carbohydrate kinase n=1 Tax=Demequina sp. NBRC 110052 TaxID=1570341 RepID=UPI0009FD4DD7|nr:PfkB family carbohydrate kinase [Demequina sp. NBRC 110052]